MSTEFAAYFDDSENANAVIPPTWRCRFLNWNRTHRRADFWWTWASRR